MAKRKQKFDTKNEAMDKVYDLGKRKRFHPQDLTSFRPASERQEEFLHSYYSQTPFILQAGFPGTGKSTIALYCALSEVLDTSTPFDQIILVRSPRETGPKIGALPGEVDEKQAPFEAPYQKIMSEITKFNDPYDNMKALGYVRFLLSTHLRGHTFDNAIIIIDEVQNFERQELFTVLTRTGNHSKIIMCGDHKQDDVTSKHSKSCYEYLIQLINNMPSERSALIRYQIEDCLRNDIVKDILYADSRIPD